MRRLIALLTVTATTLVGPAGIPGPAAQATIPGKNGRIAFSADLGLGGEIYTIQRDGTGLHQLTELDGNAFHPDWSPYGTKIAFWLEDQSLYVMNADGSDLTAVAAQGGQVSFTPDGQHLVYECAGGVCGTDGIFLMSADGSDAPGLRLTTNPLVQEGDSDPQVSPDGETVTFVRHKVEGELQALFAVGIDGSDVRKLTPYALEVAIKHDWAPDGEHIVITTNADYPNGRNPNIATIESDGSDLDLLTNFHRGTLGAFAGSYSPDGSWIVFRLQDPDNETFRLLKMHPDGSDRTLIARLPFSPRFIDWGSQPAV